MRARFVDKLVGIDFIVEVPDKAGDRDIGFADNGVGHRVALIFVVAHLVAVIHHQLMAAQPRLRSGEASENVFRIHARFATLHLGRVGDIAVVNYTAVFLVGVVEIHRHSLQLVSVAQIRSEALPHKILLRLILVTALAVDIVERCTCGKTLVHIAAKLHGGAVLCAVFVAACGVREQRHRYS